MLETLPQNIEYNHIDEYEPDHQEVCIVHNVKFNYVLALYNKETKHFVNERGSVPQDFVYWINMPINSI